MEGPTGVLFWDLSRAGEAGAAAKHSIAQHCHSAVNAPKQYHSAVNAVKGMARHIRGMVTKTPRRQRLHECIPGALWRLMVKDTDPSVYLFAANRSSAKVAPRTLTRNVRPTWQGGSPHLDLRRAAYVSR